jgi:hypothetical protein
VNKVRTKEEIGIEITKLNVRLYKHLRISGWDSEAEKMNEKVKILKWVLGGNRKWN